MDAITQHDPSTYPKDIRPIIRVLLANEDYISDGYGYYCGSRRIHETLERIAREILVATRENVEKERHV